MFTKRDDASASSNRPTASARRGGGVTGFSVIGADMVMTGNVRATADLHVEGQIDGDLDCGALVLGPDARVTGQVRADSARIAGTIEGSVSVRQLTVEAGARITGDVQYETISLETGAKIDGRLKHFSGEAPAAKPQPALGAPTELKVIDLPSEAAA